MGERNRSSARQGPLSVVASLLATLEATLTTVEAAGMADETVEDTVVSLLPPATVLLLLLVVNLALAEVSSAGIVSNLPPNTAGRISGHWS